MMLPLWPALTGMTMADRTPGDRHRTRKEDLNKGFSHDTARGVPARALRHISRGQGENKKLDAKKPQRRQPGG